MGLRDYKNFAEGEYYHVYNRGVGKMVIFKDQQDFHVFLSRLKENIFPSLKIIPPEDRHQGKNHTPYIRKTLPVGAFSLITYCLMPNHFHILIKQNTNLSITKLISKVCTSYSKYFNKKYERVGSLFQDKFKAEHVNKNEYLLWLSVYIHLNPRIANLVINDTGWKWSSYPEYLNLSPESICEKEIILEQYKNINSYKKTVEDSYLPIKNRKNIIFEILNVEFESP